MEKIRAESDDAASLKGAEALCILATSKKSAFGNLPDDVMRKSMTPGPPLKGRSHHDNMTALLQNIVDGETFAIAGGMRDIILELTKWERARHDFRHSIVKLTVEARRMKEYCAEEALKRLGKLRKVMLDN